MAETFDSANGNSTVKVKLPDGSVREFDSVDVAEIKRLAREAGVRKFHVQSESGQALQSGDFPVTSGTIVIAEYNEAKLLYSKDLREVFCV